MHRLLLSSLLLLFVSCVSFSQTHLDQVVNQLRSSKHVTSIIYTENRDPKTKKLEEEKTLISFDEVNYNNLIIEAMKKDRTDAVEYKEVINFGSSVYKITFTKGSKEIVYTLMSPCTLSINVYDD